MQKIIKSKNKIPKLKSVFLIITALILAGKSVDAAKFDPIFYSLNNINYYRPDDCEPGGTSGVNLRGADNIEKVWNFFSDNGYKPNMIAGILGNWTVESNVEPKRYETDYFFKDRYEQVEKSPTVEDGIGVSWAEFRGKYSIGLNEAGYQAGGDGKHYMGIGLGQWTGGRNKMLFDYAKKNNWSIWDLGAQLKFMMEADDPARVKIMKDLKNFDGSIEEATHKFLVSWEGVDVMGAERLKGAKDVFAKMSSKGAATASIKHEEKTNLVRARVHRNELSAFLRRNNPTVKLTKVNVTAEQINEYIDKQTQGKSPMKTMGKVFIEEATKHGIDPALIVSIAGLESRWGTAGVALETQNAFGITTQESTAHGGHREFNGWEAGIKMEAELLAGPIYKDHLHSLKEIGEIYAPAGAANDVGGTNHLWAEGVGRIYKDFTGEEYDGSGTGSAKGCSLGAQFAGAANATRTTKDGFPIFIQWQGEWAQVDYGAGMTMAEGGCGPTSFAMIMAALGLGANPLEVARKAVELGQVAAGAGAYHSQPAKLAEYYKLQHQVLSHTDISSINSHLDNGHLIWMGGQGTRPPFTSSGHIVVIRKKTSSGKWLISNPNSYSPEEDEQEFDPSFVVGQSNTATAVWK